MSIRTKVMLLLLFYLMFSSAFFGALFAGYKTGDMFMVKIGLVDGMIAQLFAGVVLYITMATDR